MGRQDFETETLIAHALSADGFDASEDGTGRGTPVVPVAICTAHTQSNGSGFSDDVAHTLESGGAQAVAFAQNLRDEVRLYGGDRQDSRCVGGAARREAAIAISPSPPKIMAPMQMMSHRRCVAWDTTEAMPMGAAR